MASGLNPVSVGLSVVRSLVSVRRPGPFGESTVDHSLFTTPLKRLKTEGPAVLSDLDGDLGLYLDRATGVSPGSLTRAEALAYWINLYNVGALRLAGQAQRAGAESVLGLPGAFSQDRLRVDGESLSLDDIEHGKLRRFGDPRIHAALVCGSVSCPTLRSEPHLGRSGHPQGIAADGEASGQSAGGGPKPIDRRTRRRILAVLKPDQGSRSHSSVARSGSSLSTRSSGRARPSV